MCFVTFYFVRKIQVYLLYYCTYLKLVRVNTNYLG